MKKKLLTLLFAMVAIAASAFDYGDFQYNVQADGTATIFGFKSGYTGSPTSITIPGYCFDSSTQKYYKVKTIGPNAFFGKTSIQRVTIQYGVEDIHQYAFNGCTSLNTVDLPSSIKSLANGVFYNAPITWINCAAETMPTLTSNAFQGLGTVSGTRYWTCATPDGMTAANAVSLITSNFTVQRSPTAADFHSHVMGSSSTNNLYDVYLNVTQGWDPATQTYGKLKLLGADARSSATNKTLKIGINQSYSQGLGNFYVTRIDKSMRYRCSTIETLDMSSTNKIDTIDADAFNGSTALTKAIVSAKVIGYTAFYNCKNLTTLQLYGSSESSQGVQQLGPFCFAGTGVSSVYIPSSVTSYSQGAFAYCGNLTQFTVSSSNNYFAADANSPNCLYNKAKTTLCQMGGGTKPAVMQDLSSSLPNTLTTLQSYCMAGAKLTTVDIPYGVKTIGNSAFYNMAYVQTIRIPSSVTTMYSNTFSGLSTTTLKHLYINLKTLPSGLQSGSALASWAGGVTLHVPLWRTNYYKTGSWWSGGWSSKISSVVEDSYDFTYGKVATGTYIDYTLYYTVNSASPYTDTYVQSAAADGQLTVVRAYLGSTGNFNGTITFRDTETHRGKTYITTEVQREVFRDQTAITRVTGGKGIKKIGALAFAGLTGCSGGFWIPNPVEFGDSSLFRCSTPNITLGKRLTTIGKDAFRSTAVEQVIMPNSVTKIGSRFLAGSTQLDSLRLSPNITEIPVLGLAWVNCRYIIIPYGVKKIGAQAFMSDEYGNGLSEPVHENIVVIPSSVTTIASNAFQYARHLDAIFLNVPYGVFSSTRADWCRRVNTNASNAYDWDGHLLYVPYEYLRAYRGDAGIKAVFDEDTWVRAGSFDFYRGSDLWTTPYRMTVLNASSKTAKYVHNGNAKVTSGSTTGFRTTEKDNMSYDNITQFQSTEYTMTEIGDGCMDATTHYAFVGVDGNNFEEHQGENFRQLTIPNTITRIGEYAFRGCTGLKTEVDVPESVAEIGNFAFFDCHQLPSIFLNRQTATTLGITLINSIDDNTLIYVPLKQYNKTARSAQIWTQDGSSRDCVLPYLKPTTAWSAISVPAKNGIQLPSTGDFYTVPAYNASTQTVMRSKLSNTATIADGTAMLFNGTVGQIYKFLPLPQGATPSTYSNNHLMGVPADNDYVSYNGGSSLWYYTFDGTKFNKATSAISVSSGDACLRLQSSDGATSSTTPVYIDENDMVTFDLWINATQVTSENAGNLSVIDGVTGTVTYNATSKTLLLNNATLTSETTNIMSKIDGLTINVVGTNSLSATSGAGSNISVKKPMTITGTGTLNASATGSDGFGCYVNDQATLTIQGGVEAHFTGKYGIFGYGSTAAPKLIVSGTDTWVTANGTTYCIFHMPTTLNDGLAITQPAGATFDSNGTVVDASGNTISRQDVVISMPMTRGFKYMGLWYEEISGTSGVTLIAPQGVTTYSGNVVIPPAFNYMGTVYEVRAIEANAFTGTAVTIVEVPSTVKTIGDGAFYGATSLSTLIFATEDMPNKLTLGEEFVGNNASDFKFYVFNPCLLAWTERYDYNFLPWVKTEDNGFLSFASSQGVTLPEGLTAYRVTGYNSSSRMATTTRLSSSAIPERTGLVLKGQPATRYLLQAASSAPAVGDNMLLPLLGIEDIPYAPFAANPDDSKIYFLGGSCEQWNLFANSVDLFMKLNLGQAYLAVDKSLLGGDYTSPVQLDLWSAMPGDVDGNGAVDVADVNILVNIMLGKENASNYPNANVDGQGGIDVSDVNMVVNIMLGKQ
ncbi:MAG: leucine-rich repeat protein [Muribaculaceae bacterium]|nr:leucine-rich repeat protein [Muribaculaceae bacterium]